MSDQQTPSRGTRTHSRGRSGTVAATGPRVPQIVVPKQSNTPATQNLPAIAAPTNIAPSASPGMLIPPTSPIQQKKMSGAPPAGILKGSGKGKSRGKHTPRPLPSSTFDSGVSAYLRLGAPGPGRLRAQRNAPRSALPVEGADNGNRAPDESQRRRETKKGPRAMVRKCINMFIC